MRARWSFAVGAAIALLFAVVAASSAQTPCTLAPGDVTFPPGLTACPAGTYLFPGLTLQPKPVVPPDPPNEGNAIDACAAGAFCQLASTKITDLPLPTRPPGTRAYITAYSGAAMDTKRGCLLVTGGGHNDYGGNEVVRFCVGEATLRWTLVAAPSPVIPPVQSACSSYGNTYADGKPASRHNYKGLAYLPDQDALLLVGGLKWCAAGDQVTPVDAWRLSLATGAWQSLRNPPIPTGQSLQINYDAATVSAYLNCANGNCALQRYDPAGDTWAAGVGTNSYGGYNSSIDPKRRLVAYLGPAGVFTQSLVTGAKVTRVLTGDALPASASVGGLAYDPVADKLVVWAGSLNVYEIDLDANTSRKVAVTGTAPGNAPDSGTYGRWAYAASKDVFVLVQGGATDVFVYKPKRSGTPIPPDPPTPDPPIPPVGTTLVPGVFYAFAPPSWGGPAAGSKHVSFTYHPPTGTVLSQGGDFQDSRTPAADSYRQEMYAFDFAAKWAAPTDRDSGWQTLQTYCRTAGTQPKSPDFVGWVSDPSRGGLWFIPGTSVIPNAAVCANRTVREQSDPNYTWRRVMFYNTATGVWADVAAPGPATSDNWMAYRDPVRDLIVRFGYDGGCGATADVFTPSITVGTGTWRHKCIESSGTGTVRLNTAALAVDEAGRRVLAVDPFTGRLWSWSMDAETLTRLADCPCGPYTSSVDKWSYAVWDSTNKRMLVWRNELATKLYVYDPATNTWEMPAWRTEPAGLQPTVISAIVYDAINNVMLFMGSRDPDGQPAHPRRIWAYRYK